MKALNTQVLPMDDPEALKLAGQLIRNGQLVAFATETVYGLGANALDAQAVARIFAAKNRPADNPLISHIADLDAAEPLTDGVSPMARDLMQAFWPGPLTLVLKRNPLVPDAVSAGLNTLSVRMPSHGGARALIRAAGVPVAAPSANRSGLPSPTRAEHVLRDMDGRIPLILDGGACAYGIESTVVDARGSVPVILRPGAVTREQIAGVCGTAELSPGVLRELKADETALSPGMKHRHYAPERARVIVLRGSDEAVAAHAAAHPEGDYRCGAALYDGAARLLPPGMASVPMGRTEQEYASRLFDALRTLDESGTELIYCQAPGSGGIGLALMNRLLRAASFVVKDV